MLSPPSVRLSIRPSARYAISPLNHRTKFNQIWCVSYSHKWGAQRQFFFAPAPWGPWEGSKGQISFNFNYKVNFKYLYTKLCVCTYKWKIQSISDEIFIRSPGSCPRGGCLRVKIKFRPAVCPICYLLLNHWTKFNQIWCVSYSHKWGVQRHFFGRAPWWGVKVKYHLISITKSISNSYTKRCVCSHKWKTQNISDWIFILLPGSCPRGWDFGALGVPR